MTYDVAWHVAALGMLVAVLLALDVLRALRFMSAGRRINAQVLEPIDEITALAQKLSVNDLGRRINVEGTKNELKDLAVVINEMLDRIELAYNGQKQFVSDASHELRTPIAVIQGYANLLDRWGKDNPQVRDEAISAIISETQSMKELVEKLLFLARHDKKTLKLRPERFDVRDMIDESIKETEIITAAHTVRTGKLDHAVVNADRGALKQAVRILVDNAVKYTPDGGVITIECAASAESVAPLCHGFGRRHLRQRAFRDLRPLLPRGRRAVRRDARAMAWGSPSSRSSCSASAARCACAPPSARARRSPFCCPGSAEPALLRGSLFAPNPPRSNQSKNRYCPRHQFVIK